MSEYDLFKGLSELDEELIMKPRKFVSLRMNLLFCIIAANISRFAPKGRPAFGIIAFILSFWAMYAFATWFMNRRSKRELLIENGPDTLE